MTPGSRRGAAVLGLSLLLNAFALGAYLSHRHMEKDGMQEPVRHFAPRDERAEHVLRPARNSEEAQTLRTLRRAIHAARRDVQQALRATDFDPATLAAALSQLRAAEQVAAEHAHQRILQAAAQLDPEQRARLAERIQHRLRGPRGGPAAPPEPPIDAASERP